MMTITTVISNATFTVTNIATATITFATTDATTITTSFYFHLLVDLTPSSFVRVQSLMGRPKIEHR
jgi:hypothetical protein